MTREAPAAASTQPAEAADGPNPRVGSGAGPGGTRLVDAGQVRVRPSVVKRGSGERARWLVKWKVAQTDRTRSLADEEEAVRFRLALVDAKRAREGFSAATGLPASMAAPEAPVTVLDLACEVVERRFARWAGGNRRARVEAFADLCAVAVTGTGTRPDRALMRRWARDHELPIPTHRKKTLTDIRVGTKTFTVAQQQAAADWMIAASLPVTALANIDTVERILDEASVSPDGKRYGPDTLQRTRSSLSLLCQTAVKKGLLATNPVRDAERVVDDASSAIDPQAVPTPQQARALVQAVCDISPNAERQYRAYLTCLWTTGMRPSEASGIRLDHRLHLPQTGWGKVTLTQPLIHPGARWTSSGTDQYEVRDRLKARKRGVVRVVLLPRETVDALLTHIEVNKVERGQLLFTNSQGQPIDPSSLSKVWRRARAQALDGRFKGLTTYELRHTAASVMLSVPNPDIPRIAAQLGNSAPVLMRTYARLFDTGDDAFMAGIDDRLGATEPLSTPGPDLSGETKSSHPD